MEFTKEHDKFYVFMRSQLGENATKIHADLKTVNGDHCSSFDTIARWIRQVKDGLKNLRSKPPPGRPKSVMTEANIDRVMGAIPHNSRVSINYLASTLQLSFGTISTILHDELDLRKVCAKWVPHKLTEDQKKTRVKFGKENLEKFGPGGTKRLTDVVTDDESWFFYYTVPGEVANVV